MTNYRNIIQRARSSYGICIVLALKIAHRNRVMSLNCFSMLQCSTKRHIYQLSKVYHRLDFEPNAIWQITYTESICRTRGLMVLTYFSSRTYIPSNRSLSRKFFNTSLIHVNKKIAFLPV